jgi:hypothetical protein
VQTPQRIDDKVNDTRMLKLFEAMSKIQKSRYLVKSEVFLSGIRIIIGRVGTSGFHPIHIDRARRAGSHDQRIQEWSFFQLLTKDASHKRTRLIDRPGSPIELRI